MLASRCFKGCIFHDFLTFQGAPGGHFGNLLAPGVALGLLERIFGQFRLSIVTFGVAFWRLWGPLWPTLGAFGLRLGLLWQTLGSFGDHFGHFVETFWTSESTFCLYRLNLGKPNNSLEIRCSGALWGSLDRDIWGIFWPPNRPKTHHKRQKRPKREQKD